ncbi:hypothetical protein WA026_016400 [Henosepilachna vigintioctopunctata]|uniref:SHSP domain-containing protein n=1 Tax=Henosepilachna vigintioctopunctata TaxID=420089 RepID=A0AAW1UKA0_9CUCU
MSLSPYFFREFMKPLRLIENQMRLTDQIFQSLAAPIYRIPETSNEYMVEDNQKLQIKLDVQEFKPDEISIKTINGNAIEIQAKHEEKYKDKSYISKQLLRRFILPEGHDIKKMVSNLSNTGVLTITAPKINPEPIESSDKSIPITHEEWKGEK